MIKLSVNEIAAALQAKIICSESEQSVSSIEQMMINVVCTDTRAIENNSIDENKGSLFIAIKGPHFDAHSFLNKAQNLGVSAFVVEDLIDETIRVPQLQVKNTRLALAQIANLAREKSSAEFIGITGSSGKTTVKEMVASILKLEGETFATIGNFNNSIGVPLSLLKVNRTTQFAVMELGASQTGEIAFTSDLVKPKVALVNNVAAAHLEGFGDLQGVAEAKSEIYASLSKSGVAIVNLDDDYANYFLQKCHSNILTFSSELNDDSSEDRNNKLADVYARNISFDNQQKASFELVYKTESTSIHLSLVGAHNVQNALAASCCCIALGISLKTICKGLSEVTSVSGRLNISFHSSGCRIIDDTYNANLESIKAAIDLLGEYSSSKILVLGDMAELGDYARQSHEEVGAYARSKNIDQLYTYGEFTKLTQKTFSKNSGLENNHFNNHFELIEALQKEIASNHTILVKGSRSAQMEKVVNAILKSNQSNTTAKIENNNKNKQQNFHTNEKIVEGET